MKNIFLKYKINFNIKILIFSLIISQNYFFLWNKRFLIHPNYLFFNTLYLLIFSLIVFYFLITLIEKTKYYFYFNLITYSYIIVKLIEIPFFYSNIINLTELIKNFYLIF